MNNNYSYTPYLEDSEDPFFVGQESWEAFVKSESEDLSSRAPPAPGMSEIMYEKPEEVPERMEEDYIPYDQELYFRNFVDEFDLSKMQRADSYKLSFEYDPNIYQNERSECTRQGTDAEQEETTSVSTRDSRVAEFNANDSDMFSVSGTDENVFDDGVFDIEAELTKKIVTVLSDRPDEEKAYIEKIFPMLLSAVKEIVAQNNVPLTDEIIAAIVKELLYGKEAMISAEREVLNEIIEDELDEVRYDRPDTMITEDELTTSNRKEKRAVKGNRNGSTMNHLNENYVSNIFQFAKRNYPEDKEVQRIGNERNVSALNFKRLTGSKLTDGIMTRKAKARIAASGKEFVENIEYWMKDGYFEQCSDREKYIYHKQKALRDLALSGKY